MEQASTSFREMEIEEGIKKSPPTPCYPVSKQWLWYFESRLADFRACILRLHYSASHMRLFTKWRSKWLKAKSLIMRMKNLRLTKGKGLAQGHTQWWPCSEVQSLFPCCRMSGGRHFHGKPWTLEMIICALQVKFGEVRWCVQDHSIGKVAESALRKGGVFHEEGKRSFIAWINKFCLQMTK